MNYPKCSTLFAVVVFLLLATQQGFAQRNPDVKAAEEEAESNVSQWVTEDLVLINFAHILKYQIDISLD